MDTRIRIIAEDITKDGVNALNRLIELEKELKIETEAANQAQKNSNTETNKSIGIIKSLEDEIQRLIKLRKESTDTTQIAAYNRQIGLQEAELKKLTDTQQKNNNETKNSNTLFSSLAKTMVGLFAVDKLIDYSKQLITLMGDTDKYRIALMNVSTSQKEYEKSIEFVSKLSKEYGQNVNILTQSYTSFIASSKSSNLSLEERQKIYQSIIKAGSALKLSNDGIEGSLRAVSQMFSKGNVSAEELRGQLGERLPGAFGIMAKSMGVSEKQLNKMLEQGEVLAKDVLPKFAEELEKLYGDKAQSNLKTIGGAWNVFVNNFIEGLQDFNKSSLFIETISSWILAAANQLKNFISFVKEAFTIGTKYNEVLNTWYDYYEVIFDAIKKIVGAGWDLIKSLGQVISNVLGVGDATLTFKKVVDFLITGVKTLGSVLIGAVTVIQVLADGFNIALNAGKKLANFFGADFKIDPKATFSNLAQNAETNFKRITDLWANSSKAVIGTAKTTNKAIVDDSDKTTKELEKDLNKQVDNNKKANSKKESDNEKHFEFIKKLKEDSAEKIKKIDEDYTKWLFDEYQKRSKIIDKSIESIEKNIEKEYQIRQSSDENLSAKAKVLTERITVFHKKGEKDRLEANEKTGKEIENNLERQARNTEALYGEIFDSVTELINEFYDYFDKKSKEGETSSERQGAALNKAFIEPFKENANAAKALLSGDFLGAAKGVYGYFKGLWDVTIGMKKTLNEIRLNEFNIQWESTMSNLSSYSDQIKQNFQGLADASVEFNQTQKTGVDALIQAEIDRAGKIRDTYTLALSKEDELYNKKIKSIDDAYNREIASINAKYALQDTLANQRFNADSLAIQTNLNNSLLALLTNEQSKTSITSEYASKRSSIMQTFALADSDITQATTQAEKDAINAAIEARTQALAELESWYTTELEFTINSEGQKRKEYSATAQLIKDASDAQDLLDIQRQADAIDREKNKQIEIETAEKVKNANIEAETKRHNDEVVRLGQEKDTALLNSFNALKDAMKAGYSEILASANEAYTSGLITAQQYLDKLKEIQALRGLVGEGTPSLTNDIRERIRNLGIPGFKTGTEMVGGIKGVDKNLAWLSNDEAVLQGDLNKKRLDAGINRFQMVEYAINYKSILDGGFHPLQIKTSALDKLEEHKAMQYLINMNVGEIVSELQGVKSALKSIPIQNFTLDENGLSKYVETKNNVTKFKAKRLK